jgi:sorting and assembly machinery component 37
VLATDFFGPLQKLRRGKRFFVSERQFSSLDCLALGYLSLMLVPELPQPWLAMTMRRKFPDLCTWSKELREEVFGPGVDIHDALPRTGEDVAEGESREKGHLPWKVPVNGGVVGVGSMFLSNVADSIPVVGQLRRNTRMRQHGGKTPEEEHSSSSQTLAVLSSILAAVGLVAGYIFHQGFISFPSSEEPEKEKRGEAGLGAFGEAGGMLSMYANQMDYQVQRQRQMEMEMSGSQAIPVVEVEIEKDGVRSREMVT